MVSTRHCGSRSGFHATGKVLRLRHLVFVLFFVRGPTSSSSPTLRPCYDEPGKPESIFDITTISGDQSETRGLSIHVNTLRYFTVAVQSNALTEQLTRRSESSKKCVFLTLWRRSVSHTICLFWFDRLSLSLSPHLSIYLSIWSHTGWQVYIYIYKMAASSTCFYHSTSPSPRQHFIKVKTLVCLLLPTHEYSCAHVFKTNGQKQQLCWRLPRQVRCS